MKFVALFLLATTLGADTLGFVEQKFSAINFEKGKWTRTAELACYAYAATAEGASVEVLRYGMGNLVPFKATRRGLTATVCSDVVAFEAQRARMRADKGERNMLNLESASSKPSPSCACSFEEGFETGAPIKSGKQ